MIVAAVALCALAVLATPRPAEGASSTPRPNAVSARGLPADAHCTRYAAPWGRDSNRGTKLRPFRTPQRLSDSIRRGQTGCLRRGVYQASGPYVLSVRRAGVRIRSYPGERARLVGIVVVRSTADAVTLSHLDIEGVGTSNTVKVYAEDVVVEDNRITNRMRSYSCMMLGSNSGTGAAVRTIVRRNRFHDCGNLANGNKDHGIYAANVRDGQITGNVFWNIAAYAVHLYPNAQRTRVARNVIDGGSPSVRGGLVFGGDTAYTSKDNVVERNVIAYSTRANIESWWGGAVGTGNVVRENCVWGAKWANVRGHGFTAQDNIVADPAFRNRSRRDYRLAPNSPCLRVLR